MFNERWLKEDSDMIDHWIYYLILILIFFTPVPFLAAERAKEQDKKAKKWGMLCLGISSLCLLFTLILYADISMSSILTYFL